MSIVIPQLLCFLCFFRAGGWGWSGRREEREGGGGGG